MVKNKNWLSYSLILVATVFSAALLFNLINRHSVNVLFWDHWDYLIPLFGKPTAWEMFSFQHGPHRQGLGLFVSQMIGTATNWNTRAEAFFIGIVLIFVAITALYLKHRLFGKLTAWDALIPILCLSFVQCEIAFPNQQPAYTALPLLLVMLAGVSLTAQNPVARYLLLTTINFFAVFTGFGLFLGLVVPFVLTFAAFVHWTQKQKRDLFLAVGALSVALLSITLFFVDYRFLPATDCFEFPHPRPFEYAQFIGDMMAMCVGLLNGYIPWIATLSGFFLFLLWITILLRHAWQLVKTRKLTAISLVIFMFLGYSLLYAVNVAIGRVCLGVQTAHSSRYMTLLIPGWLALYFTVLLLKPPVLQKISLLVLVILFFLLPLRWYNVINNQFAPLTEMRKKWAACYRERENIVECDQISGHPVYPNAEATELQEKLDLLKQKQLNLFSEK